MTSAGTDPTDANVSDAELWDRLRDGDVEALGVLFDRHAQAVHTFAFRRTASWAVAEDVVQSTFVKAWKRFSSSDPGPLTTGSARGWLLVVAGNECRTTFRAAYRLRAAIDRLPRPEPGPDHADDVAGRLDDERRMKAVRRAVRRLPRHERDTLELVAWSGLSIADAAIALGVPEGTVKGRLHRARKRLADLLTQAGSTQETP
jgi:RNA polymerase sigma-70 factor (ECF subfamily)